MKTTNLVCIICPNSCKLKVEEEEANITVFGNKCLRGYEFAVEEVRCPKRVIASTVATVFKDFPVVPVGLTKAVDRDKIFLVMKEINKIVLREKVGMGYVLVENILDLGADLVVTSNIMKGEDNE